MGTFRVLVLYAHNGKPAPGYRVSIDYGLIGGQDRKNTNEKGIAEFSDHDKKWIVGDFFVDGVDVGKHRTTDGAFYTFTLKG